MYVVEHLAHELVTSQAFIVINVGNEFNVKLTWPNDIWRTDFAFQKVLGWRGCTTTTMHDVIDMPKFAFTESGGDKAEVE